MESHKRAQKRGVCKIVDGNLLPKKKKKTLNWVKLVTKYWFSLLLKCRLGIPSEAAIFPSPWGNNGEHNSYRKLIKILIIPEILNIILFVYLFIEIEYPNGVEYLIFFF